MANVIDQVVKKTRYISVRLAGEEVYSVRDSSIKAQRVSNGVYVEHISSEVDLVGAVPAGKLRLREIQKVMPLGDWSLHPVRNAQPREYELFLTG